MDETASYLLSMYRNSSCNHIYFSSHKLTVMKTNMGTADRLIRIVIAAGFAALYFTGAIGNTTLATVLWVLGLIFFITAAIGFCPLYALFGLNTRKKTI